MFTIDEDWPSRVKCLIHVLSLSVDPPAVILPNKFYQPFLIEEKRKRFYANFIVKKVPNYPPCFDFHFLNNFQNMLASDKPVTNKILYKLYMIIVPNIDK